MHYKSNVSAYDAVVKLAIKWKIQYTVIHKKRAILTHLTVDTIHQYGTHTAYTGRRTSICLLCSNFSQNWYKIYLRIILLHIQHLIPYS